LPVTNFVLSQCFATPKFHHVGSRPADDPLETTSSLEWCLFYVL